MYRFLIATCVLVVLGLVLVLAISSVEPKADVVLVNGAEVKNLDPARMTWSHDIRTAFGLWEGLLTLDPEHCELTRPGVAESYTVSDDGLVYTFRLRDTARWSNGDPVTARDFRFAWMRVLDPATASDYYTYMQLIDGAEEYYNALKDVADGKRTAWPDPARVGIEVVNDQTLRVRLARPAAYFPELVAFSTFLPVHGPSMEKFKTSQGDEPPRYTNDWLKAGKLVSNGPFTLTRWDFNYRLVLTRNPHYWDAKNVPSERIELLANADANTAFLAYESKAADVITNLPEAVAPTLIAQAAAGRRKDVYVFPVWGTYYYRFNCKEGPLRDPRVRQALAMSVNRTQIVESITKRGERAQTSFVTPGLSLTLPAGKPISTSRPEGPGWRLAEGGRVIEYVPADGLPFDPPAARKLLAEAGYGPGGKRFAMDDGQNLSLLINESTGHKAIAEAVTKMWRDHLGIQVQVDTQILNIAAQWMNTHNFKICRSGWYTDYSDPTGFLTMFRKDDGNNDGQFDVPEYDACLAEADRTADPVRRYESIHRAEQILVRDQAGVIPLYQLVGQFLYRPGIEGIYQNPKQQIMLKYLRKK